MSSMEPSLQPSFTFPSRHNLQNYAKGIVDLSSSTQRLLVKPKFNTDIDLQTSLQTNLTVPKTLDKDVIDYPGVLPVEAGVYVQPGLAEGMTNVAKSSESEKIITSVTSANNAMKRGNYKAAEKLIGRPVTIEEMQNRTITPETRSSENNPNVKYGVKFDNIAFGALTSKDSQFSFHQREKMLKEAEPYLINAISKHLGINPAQASFLKTSMNFTGDSVLGYQNGSPAARAEILRQFKYQWDILRSGLNSAQLAQRQEDEGNPIHSGERAARAAAQDARQRAEEREDAEPPPPQGRRFSVHDEKGEDNGEEEIPRAPPMDDDHHMGRGIGGKVSHRRHEYEDPEVTELKEAQIENFPPISEEFSGPSRDPIQEIMRRDKLPIRQFSGPPLETPAVLENVITNAPLGRQPAPQAETNFNLQALGQANVERHDENMGYFPPDEVRIRQELPLENHQPKRTLKRKTFTPYSNSDFHVDTDSFYPSGGVLSSNLMKSTGRNAVPLSAQIQVANTHQWTETPLQEWVRHPNYQSDLKPKPIPISQNFVGVNARRKKVRFGNYMLDHHKLMTGGVLSLSHPTGKKVKGMPNREVTPGLKEVIHAICTGDKVNTKKLTAGERMVLKDLIGKSTANVDLGGDVNVTPSQQLSLILGEIEAGNDSQELKRQLKKLLPSLKRGKIITAEQMMDISKHYL